MTAGYSTTPLLKKLGLKPGMRLLLVGVPPNVRRLFEPLPEGVTLLEWPRRAVDYIHVFADRRADLLRHLERVKPRLARDGLLWLSWPKKSSGVETDLSGDVVREAGLEAGLVDVKVAAVDETWSGLKFVYRLEDR